MSGETAIAAALALPAAGAAGVVLTGRWPNLRETVTLLTCVATFAVVCAIARDVIAGADVALRLADILPGVALGFRLEPLGMLYALVAAGLWIPTSVYAIGYMRGHHETHQTRFFVCFALAICAALGIAFSANLFTFFLFYEMLTLSTYPLVTHAGTEAARRAGRLYLGTLLFTSVSLLLLAILITWHTAGTLEFRPGGVLADKASPALATLLLALYAFGIGKAALMPFHRWLPAAMVAPTPVSALLHAVAVVKAGVFAILKVVVYVFGPTFLITTGISVWLMYVAAATIVIASIVALRKDNLKARLAYSTISQLAYVVLGAALATTAGIAGAALQIATHAAGKITLFFCAGAIMVATHKTEVSELDGIGRRMPLTMAAFGVASLSIVGLPPLGGAWSKWFLTLGAVEGHHYVLLAVLMLSSLLSIGYLLPIVARAFFVAPPVNAGVHGLGHGHGHGDRPGSEVGVHEAPALCVVPLCATAAICVALFFAAPVIRAWLAPILGELG
jgi:multicomponent Na+:H+ antiporter subunit D